MQWSSDSVAVELVQQVLLPPGHTEALAKNLGLQLFKDGKGYEILFSLPPSRAGLVKNILLAVFLAETWLEKSLLQKVLLSI